MNWKQKVFSPDVLRASRVRLLEDALGDRSLEGRLGDVGIDEARPSLGGSSKWLLLEAKGLRPSPLKET